MKRFATLALLMAIPALAALAADEKPAGIEGTYKVTEFSHSGKQAPDQFLKKFQGVTITGDKFSIKLAGEVTTSTIKIDVKSKPATIDLTPDDVKDPKQIGIWKLEKGVLTITVTEGKDAKRPTSFDAKGADDYTFVLTLEQPKK